MQPVIQPVNQSLSRAHVPRGVFSLWGIPLPWGVFSRWVSRLRLRFFWGGTPAVSHARIQLTMLAPANTHWHALANIDLTNEVLLYVSVQDVCLSKKLPRAFSFDAGTLPASGQPPCVSMTLSILLIKRLFQGNNDAPIVCNLPIG